MLTNITYCVHCVYYDIKISYWYKEWTTMNIGTCCKLFDLIISWIVRVFNLDIGVCDSVKYRNVTAGLMSIFLCNWVTIGS